MLATKTVETSRADKFGKNINQIKKKSPQVKQLRFICDTPLRTRSQPLRPQIENQGKVLASDLKLKFIANPSCFHIRQQVYQFTIQSDLNHLQLT